MFVLNLVWLHFLGCCVCVCVCTTKKKLHAWHKRIVHSTLQTVKTLLKMYDKKDAVRKDIHSWNHEKLKKGYREYYLNCCLSWAGTRFWWLLDEHHIHFTCLRGLCNWVYFGCSSHVNWIVKARQIAKQFFFLCHPCLEREKGMSVLLCVLEVLPLHHVI